MGRLPEVKDFNKGYNRKAFLGNPWNVEVLKNETSLREQDLRTRDFKVRQYSWWRNNCQHHAYAVLEDMGLR